MLAAWRKEVSPSDYACRTHESISTAPPCSMPSKPIKWGNTHRRNGGMPASPPQADESEGRQSLGRSRECGTKFVRLPRAKRESPMRSAAEPACRSAKRTIPALPPYYCPIKWGNTYCINGWSRRALRQPMGVIFDRGGLFWR